MATQESNQDNPTEIAKLKKIDLAHNSKALKSWRFRTRGKISTLSISSKFSRIK